MTPDLTPVRLACFDLDETLLGPDHRPGPRTGLLAPRLADAGIVLAVATGRAPEASRAIAQELGAGYLIAVNGAWIGMPDGRLLHHEVIAEPAVAAIVAWLRERGTPFYLMSPQGYFSDGEGEALEAANRVRGVLPRPLPAILPPAMKIMPLGENLPVPPLGPLAAAVEVVQHPEYLEIGPAGVDKATAIKWLSRRLGIARREVLCCGDAGNDRRMVEWAGVGVAMGDAQPGVRAVADWICPPHHEDGTGAVIAALLEGDRSPVPNEEETVREGVVSDRSGTGIQGRLVQRGR